MSETQKHIPLINVDEQGEILIDYRCGGTITKHFIFSILQKQQSIMSLALHVSLNKAFSTTDLANLTLCQDSFAKKHRMHLAQEKTAFFTRPLPGVS